MTEGCYGDVSCVRADRRAIVCKIEKMGTRDAAGQTHFEELVPRPKRLLLQTVDIVWQEPLDTEHCAFFTSEPGAL
jgi:hypothetical protein